MAVNQATRDALTELYIATFNRAPDPTGLDYWYDKMANGWSLQTVARSFFDQPETKLAYPATMTSTEIVNKVYNNVLGRDADSAGLTYWTNQLDTGAVARQDIIIAVINGAKAPTGSATDAVLLANKTEVGNYFLTLGTNDTTYAAQVMAQVTSDVITVAEAKSTAFTTTALTSSTDAGASFAGTALNNGFTAASGALNNADIISGAGGTDTLTVTNGAATLNPTLSSIEKVVLTATGALTLDASRATGIDSVTNFESSAALTVSNLADVATLRITSVTDKATTINYTDAALAGSSDNMTIILSGLTDDGTNADSTGNEITVTDAGGTTNKLETVTVRSSTTANEVEDLFLADVGTTQLVIVGDQNLTFENALENQITSISATAFTGKLSLTSGTGNDTILGGTGNDTISTGVGNNSVLGGAGQDSITGGSAADYLNGGAGNDTLTGSGGNDSIYGDTGNDSVDVSGAAGTVSVYGESGADTINVGAYLDANDVIVGGADTDVLVVANATAGTVFTGVSGVEKIALSGSVSSLTTLTSGYSNTGFTTLTLDTATADSVAADSTFAGTFTVEIGADTANIENVDFSASAATITFTATNGINSTDVFKGGSTANDVLSYSTSGVNASADSVDVSASAGIETITIVDAAADTVGADVLVVIADATAADSTRTYTLDATALDGAYTVSGTAYSETVAVDAAAAGSTDKWNILLGAGADSVSAGAGNDTIYGYGGNDTIGTGAGANYVVAGDGADSVLGGSGIDTILGGDGNDVLAGGGSADNISAGLGADTININSAADLQVTSFTETIDGGAGTDRIQLKGAGTYVAADFNGVTNVEWLDLASTSSLTLGSYTSGLNVKFNTADTVDASSATSGVTFLYSTNNTADGADSLSTFTGSSYGDSLYLADTVNFNPLADGTTATASWTLGAGNDTIYVSTNTLTVDLAAYSGDTVGTSAAVTVTGALSAEYLTVLDTDGDTITPVTIFASTVDDAAAYSLTIDASALDAGAESLVASLADTDGTYTITGGASGDSIATSNGNDSIVGNDGADTITSGSGNDTIYGGDGADKLQASSGNDLIYGGSGADTIDAGSGNDTVYAGEGADTITLSSGFDVIDLTESTAARDVIVADTASLAGTTASPISVTGATVDDVITFSNLGAMTKVANTTAIFSSDATVNLTVTSGVLTADATLSLGDLFAAANQVASSTYVVAFEHGGSTYLVEDRSGTSYVIKLVGLDIATMSVTSNIVSFT